MSTELDKQMNDVIDLLNNVITSEKYKEFTANMANYLIFAKRQLVLVGFTDEEAMKIIVTMTGGFNIK